MERSDKVRKMLHEAFDVGLIIKGFDGILEAIGGILLFFTSPAMINRIVVILTQHELSMDPKDIVANYLVNFARDFSVSTQIFGSIFLLSHGIIKIFLVYSLLKKKLWAYPTAMAIFIVFIIYQVYRFSFTGSLGLIILSLLDVLVVYLTLTEYKRLKTIITAEK